MATPLPTPRQLLTSLLTTISEIPSSTPAQQHPQQNPPGTTTTTDPLPARPTAAPSNPLKSIPPTHRPLLTTLHVLFPSLLLPALDLLDRGLVTRLTLPLSSPPPPPPPPHDGSSAQPQPPPPPPSKVYHVRSAQPSSSTSSRRFTHRDGDGPTSAAGKSRYYVVHTAVWNCTCAAFAFAAFPPVPAPVRARPHGGTTSDNDEDGGGAAREWEFGGLSSDGTGVGGGRSVPPCCKHLLACVLAERWEGVLGRYVNGRVVGREEMAGIFADI